MLDSGSEATNYESIGAHGVANCWSFGFLSLWRFALENLYVILFYISLRWAKIL